MTDDIRLFDAALTDALGGETVETLMDKHGAAARRGDWERVRWLDEMLRTATVLGTHAVIAERTRRGRQ